eukprot:gene6974-biopygen4450
MGSQSDWATMRHAADILETLDIEHEARIISAHRTPDRLVSFSKGAKAAGYQVIIAGAGGAAHLPGMCAAMTSLPVLGVPVETKTLSGIDSLYSIVQMPGGIPVGTLAIGKAGAINAALLAASILALHDEGLAIRLADWRAAQTAQTDSPAFEVAGRHTIAAYDDVAALKAFAVGVDVITYEFENIPVEAVAVLETIRPVYPDRHALAISQDRLHEKSFFNSIGIATAPFADVKDAGELARAVAQIGRPSILKTRRFGYDGKGQVLVREAADLAVIHRSIGGHPSILEGLVRFSREVSVIAARGRDGQFAAYDVAENQHANHILSRTIVPAHIQPATADMALNIAKATADALDYVGVFAVELFVVQDKDGGSEQLIVNEMAPRVHNSGHWTLDGAITSQFEQHIRAICGWPLGNVRRHGRIEMQNLIGADVDNWQQILSDNASLRLYGKAETKTGRKMGHVTRVLPE